MGSVRRLKIFSFSSFSLPLFFCLFVYFFVCLQHVCILQATASLPLPGRLTHICTLAWWLQRTASSGADDVICDDGVYVCLSPLVMMMGTIWWWPGGFRGQQAQVSNSICQMICMKMLEPLWIAWPTWICQNWDTDFFNFYMKQAT